MSRTFTKAEMSLFWDLEVLGIRAKETNPIEENVIQYFLDTRRVENNRYVVSWPWKVDVETIHIPSLYRMCFRRLETMVRNTHPIYCKGVRRF